MTVKEKMRYKSHQAKVGFKHGNLPHNKGSQVTKVSLTSPSQYKRLTKGQYLATRGMRCADATQSDTARPARRTSMLLRPRRDRVTQLQRAQVAETQDPETNTNRLVHLGKTASLWNEAFHQHSQENPRCGANLTWDTSHERRRGLASAFRLKCSQCKYTSVTHKLYTEVKTNRPGPNPAAVNLGLQAGLAHTSLSATGIVKLLLATNTPAPNLSSLQKAANKIKDVLVKSNEDSMERIMSDIRVAGSAVNPGEEETHIDIQADCRYNNNWAYSVANSPFQPATQVVQLAVENTSPKKHVIGVTTRNKLCRCLTQNSRLRQKKRKTKSVEQPTATDTTTTGTPREAGHSISCSADIAMHDSIGDERRWTTGTLTHLSSKGITARNIITDPDSQAFKAAEDVYLAGRSQVAPQHQLDTRHVTANQRKKVKAATFSKNMFPGRTAESRSISQRDFGNDLGARCHAEQKAAMKAFGGDHVKANLKVADAKTAVIECYMGNHSLCKKHSLVCKGTKRRNWVNRSAYLPNDFRISPTPTDVGVLKELINYRLGTVMWKKTKHFQNTQKVESVNRALTSTNPRNITFSRNFAGRVHTAIHSVNDGVGESIFTSCADAGAHLTPGTRVTHKLLSLQKAAQRRKIYKQSRLAINARYHRRRTLYALHRHKASQKKGTTYKTAMLMPKSDHAYSKL